MVSTLSIVFMFITLFLSIGFPIGLVIYMYRKEKISMKAVFIGALMFFVFQVILRIPALTVIQTRAWYQSFAMQNQIITGIIIAFTAGLFETAGRYIGLKYILKDRLNRVNSIAYGIGHGGIEAILLVGLSYIGNIVYSFLINTGAMDSILVPILVATEPILFLVSGIERIFAILFHIAAALLVGYGIMKNKKVYIFYSLMLHFLLDGVAVVLQIIGAPIWGAELWVALVGIAGLMFVLTSKKFFLIEKKTIENGGYLNEDK